MKRAATIAKELRANGRKFSQTTLLADLLEFTPVFKEGKVIFFEDSVTESLMSRYKIRLVPEPVVEVVYQPTQADRIEHMLTVICKELGVSI